MKKTRELLNIMPITILAGLLTGIVVSLYNIMMEHISKFSATIYQFCGNNKIYILLLYFCLVVLYFVSYFLIYKCAPNAKGSGIPQSIALMKGLFSIKSLHAIVVVILVSAISMLTGLALGNEGPSIFIGSLISIFVARAFKKNLFVERILTTGGAGAGMAVAFNAPLSGIIFTIEEGSKKLSFTFLTSVIILVLTANFTSMLILGDRVYFNFPFEYLPLSKYPYLLLIGLCAGVFGAIFNKLLLATKPFFIKMQTKKFNFNLLIPFLLAGVIGLFLFDATGGGFATISKLFSDNLTLKMIAMVLVVRFLYTIICANSNMIGGLFVPMLCLGALLGGLLFGLIAKIDASLPKNLLILLTMLGFFCAVTHSPLTTIALSVELTRSANSLFPMFFVAYSAMIIAKLLRTKPLYEELCLLLDHNKLNDVLNKDSIFEYTVCANSLIDGKKPEEISLPNDINILYIIRNEVQYHAVTIKRIEPNDKIYVEIISYDVEKSKNMMKLITSNIREFDNSQQL